MVVKSRYDFTNLGEHLAEFIDEGFITELTKKRWFGRKNEELRDFKILDYGQFELLEKEELAVLLFGSFLIRDRKEGLDYREHYFLPLIITRDREQGIEPLLEIEHRDYLAFIYDGVHLPGYVNLVEELVRESSTVQLEKGRIEACLLSGDKITTTSCLTELSSNSLTLVKKEKVLKTIRRLKEGLNPELEIGMALFKHTSFKRTPVINGAVQYIDDQDQSTLICLLQEYIPNRGDMWDYSRDYFQKLFGQSGRENLQEEISGYLKEIFGLGELIADLHLALAGIDQNQFIPVKFREKDLDDLLRDIITSYRSLLGKLQGAGCRIEGEELTDYDLRAILQEEKHHILNGQTGQKIRIHGDLHLGQIMRSRDGGYVVFDFEGEPARELAERRERTSPLKDAAGILRSFNYVFSFFLIARKPRLRELEGNISFKRVLSRLEELVNESFLEGYLSRILEERAELLPERKIFSRLLSLYQLQKALYEAHYELDNRPDWLPVPLTGIIDCLKDLVEMEDIHG